MFAVAGASGRTGRVVAESLLAQGRKVRVLLRSALHAEGWRARGAEVAVVSLEDEAALARSIAGAAGLYALLPEDPAVPDLRAHRRRMADALAGAVTAGRVSNVVFLSAAAAALTSGNGPARELRHAEDALRATAARVTAIRASFFQENVLAAREAAARDGVYPSFFPSSDLAFPTIATRDIGRIAARCLVEPPAKNEIIDAVGPMYSVRQLADALGVALGKPLHVVDIPAAAHVEVLARAGVPLPFAQALAELFACLASGRVAPQGDRMVTGTTTIDQILPGLVGEERA